MNSQSLTLAIIGHLVGDYLLQNDWMALHKKKNGFRCAIHAAIWTASVMAFSGWWNCKWTFTIAAFLGCTHYLQDHTDIVARWMDFIGQHHFRKGPCAPWSIIVVDNVWHIVTLWAVWRFLA